MECSCLEEVRDNINEIDQEIVKLICQRETYVRQAAKFKKNTKEVADSERVSAVLKKVRGLAESYQGTPQVVEAVYREMIRSFIELEMESYHIRIPGK